MTVSQHNAQAHRTVGELVTEDYRRAAVFKRFGIDFCCGGGAALDAVCRKKGLDVDEVTAALDAAEGRGHGTRLRVEAWSPAFLADYIVNEHHTYVRESIPVLRAFTQKLARVHGHNHPELVRIADLFERVATGLEAHLVSEEQVVFPSIRAVAGSGAAETSRAPLRSVIQEMEEEHEEAGELMRQIRALSADFTPPLDACNTYRAAYVKLEEFEDDLHRHVHLENNVLFPKAIALDEASGAQAEAAGVAEKPAFDAAPPRQAASEKVLDVRLIPPPQKHPAIFSTFDALAPGSYFVLVNDHDPVPLKYQFEFTRAGQVGWKYIEQGPDVWRVEISKQHAGGA